MPEPIDKDARQKVTGQIPYALNVELPGMAYARCVRSPKPEYHVAFNVVCTVRR